MTVLTTTSQAECLAILISIDSLHLVVPVPPQIACYAVTQLNEDNWLCVENDNGQYTCTGFRMRPARKPMRSSVAWLTGTRR